MLTNNKKVIIEKKIVCIGSDEASIASSQLKSFVIVPYKNPTHESRQDIFFNIQKTLSIGETINNNPKKIFIRQKLSRNEYIQKIKFLKSQIQKGNIYEINFCIEFFAEDVQLDVLTVFHRLELLSRAPYSKLVKINDDYILSASPELFLKREGNILFTKPIKGTIKRGNTKEEDEQLKDFLFHNVKERTENVMAVDVARNDLSRIAKRGSVNVNKLYNIESFETVHQMVSTVSCELKNDCTFSEILDATFPMASMTGAPKISAMNLISSTENFDRNYYSGAMGFVQPNGDFELSVVIRSIFYNSATRYLSFAVGSAITHLCDPEKEYEECLLKAKALLEALNAEIKH
jgi:para-aminobenzoate synthetase component I